MNGNLLSAALRPDEDHAEGPIDCAPLGETLARAEAASEALRSGYPDWTRADLGKAQAALDAAGRDPEQRRAHLDALYAVMHDIKGQGSSFGYPLMTRIAASLCCLVAPDRQPGEAALVILQAHLDALNLVLDHGIAGSGGEIGDKLASRLEMLAEKAIGE